MNAYDTFNTPLGDFTAAVNDDGVVVGTAFGDVAALCHYTRLHLDDLTHEPQRVAHVRKQIEQYFQGERQEFDLALTPSGTTFQHNVWRALREIPFNQTRSYGQLATMLGTSPRAMGGANGSNRICLIVPCHRVIGSDGSLTGFAYGTEIKRRLLEHEARVAAAAVSQPSTRMTA
jgi:methylated-DNA-[protein]-cysteine S-methyltransferase